MTKYSHYISGDYDACLQRLESIEAQQTQWFKQTQKDIKLNTLPRSVKLLGLILFLLAMWAPQNILHTHLEQKRCNDTIKQLELLTDAYIKHADSMDQLRDQIALINEQEGKHINKIKILSAHETIFEEDRILLEKMEKILNTEKMNNVSKSKEMEKWIEECETSYDVTLQEAYIEEKKGSTTVFLDPRTDRYVHNNTDDNSENEETKEDKKYQKKKINNCQKNSLFELHQILSKG